MNRISTLLLTTTLALCGCGALQTDSAIRQTPFAGAAFQGSVHGGQQPVANSVIQLYAVGAAGDGSNSQALILGSTVKTLSNGTFNISATYTCPSQSALVYLVAQGGNPGLSPATANNAALTLMTALGSCGSLTTSSFISMNELTTVAAVAALSNFMSSYTQIGSGTSDAAALSNAFALSAEFVNPATGTAPGATLPAGYSSPVALINTLADSMATCINSAGGNAGDGSACGNFFTAAAPSGVTPPAETVGATLDIVKNPNQNVTAIFNLATASSPFQPVLSFAPADWTVPLLPTAVTRILFVGDSFTYGRYAPVRNYNAAAVTDENYGLPANNSRAETSTEPGPYGGIPGIFKMLTTEAGLSYDVHQEGISATSLATHYSIASAVIANPQWNAVVLQDVSNRPLPRSLSGSSTSNAPNYCSSVKTIEQGIHSVNAAANVYIYGTWARADEAQQLGSSTYLTNLTNLTNAYHNVFYRAAVLDGKIAGVAVTGDAWQLAIQNGVVMANPYTSTTGPFLWYGINSTNDPAISSADEYHPSIYGAYLSALVLYGQITGQDPASFGASEAAASALGINSALAVQLQQTAHTQLYSGSSAPINQTADPCSTT